MSTTFTSETVGWRQGAGARIWAIALACAIALAAWATASAGTAKAATTVHPAGGSGFDAGPDGWTGSDTSCTLPLVCTASNTHEPAGGAPGGAIATNADIVLGLVGLFEATGTWTSPPFAIPADADVGGATFQYDRAFGSDELLDLDPQAEVVVELVDDTAGSTAVLLTDTLSGPEPDYTTRGVGAPAGAVVAGHAYRLRLTSTISSSTASIGLLAGDVSMSFDNVSLAVSDAPGGGGGGGGGGTTPDVSAGVTIVRGPYTNVEIANIIGRFDVDAEVGDGPGGSLIPLALCTIVGTPGHDRITGTSGNDVICGLGGHDVISGAAGRDAIDGANGADRLTGALGGDLLLGLRGADRLNGGGGPDRVGGGAGADRANGGNGKDLVSGASGADRVNGAAGRDRLRGRAGKDRLNGGPGPDRIDGGRGRDVIRGRSGSDRLFGRAGNDRIDGGGGRDVVMGGAGRDRLMIRDGRRDRANGGPHRDVARADRVDRVRRVARVARR
jgi:Ca2+-binding RTX toxin-like protein